MSKQVRKDVLQTFISERVHGCKLRVVEVRQYLEPVHEQQLHIISSSRAWPNYITDITNKHRVRHCPTDACNGNVCRCQAGEVRDTHETRKTGGRGAGRS